MKSHRKKAGPAPPPGVPLHPSLPNVPVQRWNILGVCVLLAVITFVVFAQTFHFEFINFDDDAYVYENPAVRSGLNEASVAWAFTHSHGGNWHPVTSLSHLLDGQLFGLNAGAHHATNVVLHAATAILLFLVLRQMTSAFWPSAFVAAVFAVHPLRVESVAWVSERKDVLSGLFFILTLWSYVRYARKPKSLLRYLAVLFWFALGLMSKPMLVTVPFVLLLLDYWPLNRVSGARGQVSGEKQRAGIPAPDPSHLAPDTSPLTPDTPHLTLPCSRLLIEKIPLFLLSAALCVVTLLVQQGAIRSGATVSVPMRIANAFLSAATYGWNMIWPVNLAVFYPYPSTGVALGKMLAALFVLGVVSVIAVRWRRKHPYVLVGWLWYLGMLLPVIGLVQVGAQARADRYTYLPQIGLYLLFTWLAVDWSGARRQPRQWLGIAAICLLTALILRAGDQTQYWRNNELLWTHTIACTEPNAIAENNLASALSRKGRLDEAIVHSQKALTVDPDYGDAHNCLGEALFRSGKLDAAIPHFREALRLQPGSASVHNNFGMALFRTGQIDEAIAEYQQALTLEPDQAQTHNNLGVALLQKGDAAAALAHYRKSLELDPTAPNTCNNLAWLLATCPQAIFRNGPLAIELAQRANHLSSEANVVMLRTLAAAYAETGRFPEALDTAGQAVRLAASQNNAALVNILQHDQSLYQSGQPLRTPMK